jgi:hypothetical protein
MELNTATVLLYTHFFTLLVFRVRDILVQGRETSAGSFLQEFPQLVPSRREAY